MNGQIVKILRSARRQGWAILPKKDGVQLRSPDGNHISHIHSNHSSDSISKGLLNDLKKAGFII